jgi:dienelactone hydrolase
MTFPEAAAHFTYDASVPLDLHELSVRTQPGAAIHDITYASPDGGLVPAYLVVPSTQAPHGRFAAILWAHWMLPNSPSANREEFLAEALALAPSGVVSLLIDAPQVRPGFKPVGAAELNRHQVLDMRRGLDLLIARRDIDPRRIAVVGHSFDSGTAAILDAVETRPDKRPAAFVFMSGPQSVRQLILTSQSPHIVALRQNAPAGQVEKMLEQTAWADPGTFAAHLGPAPALFQYAKHDEEWVPLTNAEDYFASALASPGPKEVKYYDADHALNAQARRDRIAFLARHLAFTPPPAALVDAIPQTK